MKIFNINSSRQQDSLLAGGADRKGLIFIPDISGFTELVRSTDPLTGKSITYGLLSTIMAYNILDLEIAEIEGDAIFFFKWMPLPSVDDVMAQFEVMKSAFDEKKKALEIQYRIVLDLQLKAVAHYGTMSEFFLGGFRKLYGEVVVEAHNLLKNNIPERSYLLITDELNNASVPKNIPVILMDKFRTSKLCELYRGLRNICYTYVLFEPKLNLTA